MGKTVIFLCLACLLFGCKKRTNCPQEIVLPINPDFINWTKPYPKDTIGYVRFKSDKGPEESLLIERDMTFSEWYLQNTKEDGPCVSTKSECRDYYLSSTIYKKKFQIEILQYSRTETLVEIVNRSGEMDAGSIIFSSNNSYHFQYSPCDTCMHYFTNFIVNNKSYDKVIRMYCPKDANSFSSERIKEIYVADGYGIIQYTCSDNTVWNIVN